MNKNIITNSPNQASDVLIAETAINNELILVTRDANLAKLIREFGGTSVHTNNLPQLK
jgi:predicted nucleic acid-binding protein